MKLSRVAVHSVVLGGGAVLLATFAWLEVHAFLASASRPNEPDAGMVDPLIMLALLVIGLALVAFSVVSIVRSRRNRS
ncbi:hypothetical protein G3T36_08325 [Diaminobutyricibacter tongyongensis]|uniref:Uncharacterized protein n=1 Tax=Leifsonia tongyongensis TaxID=1268043 RepID=A0A6L9XY15_9MICO|nr:hypothetical protein [Diaminobutyricibacter tongyongensis]NEN05878.1 hypothetical protein [Diaminobutyricibacter tongyongensis]